MSITIIKDARQTGSFHQGTIMVGDVKVGTCHIGCLRPSVDLVWDNDMGQPIVVTLLPKLESHGNVEAWMAKQIKSGKFPVITR